MSPARQSQEERKAKGQTTGDAPQRCLCEDVIWAPNARRYAPVDTSVALAELRNLMQAARDDPAIQQDTTAHRTWKAKSLAVLEGSLGSESSTVKKFAKLRYGIGIYSGAPGEAERDAQFFRAKVAEAAGLLEAAIYELELTAGPAPAADYDPGLWDHVKHSVDQQRWEQVASAAVIYIEDKVRRWAGNPVDKTGSKLHGQALFARVLGQGGELSLGSQPSETDGWRNLGTGLVAALGNVDRHGIQDRDDARPYALGVLGLASLLLTQVKHQHPTKVR